MLQNFQNDMQLLKLIEDDRILQIEIEKFYSKISLIKLDTFLNDIEKFILNENDGILQIKIETY